LNFSKNRLTGKWIAMQCKEKKNYGLQCEKEVGMSIADFLIAFVSEQASFVGILSCSLFLILRTHIEYTYQWRRHGQEHEGNHECYAIDIVWRWSIQKICNHAENLSNHVDCCNCRRTASKSNDTDIAPSEDDWNAWIHANSNEAKSYVPGYVRCSNDQENEISRQSKGSQADHKRASHLDSIG